jgi:hypothetical protein
MTVTAVLCTGLRIRNRITGLRIWIRIILRKPDPVRIRVRAGGLEAQQ